MNQFKNPLWVDWWGRTDPEEAVKAILRQSVDRFHQQLQQEKKDNS